MNDRPLCPTCCYDPWTTWSAQSLLLPYLEQTSIYNAANFNWAPDGDNTCYQINRTVYNMKLSAFMCPSDPNTGKQNLNNYHVSMGTSSGVEGLVWLNMGTSGMFGSYYGANLRDVTDGTANTVAMAEALTGDGKGNSYGGYGPPSKWRGNGIMQAGGGEDDLSASNKSASFDIQANP